MEHWAAFLAAGLEPGEVEAMRASSRTGRPLGGAAFVTHLERAFGRHKPGPKPNHAPLDLPRSL